VLCYLISILKLFPCFCQQNDGDSVSVRSGKGAIAETSRAASVVPNDDETSWTDVNLDEQKDEQQQQQGGEFLIIALGWTKKCNNSIVLLIQAIQFK